MGAVELVLVRHGESVGNVARAAAKASSAEIMNTTEADAAVPLSELGRAQAAALGRWLGGLPDAARPGVVWTSSYARAAETAAIALDSAGLDAPVRRDERLRDRELGVLDRLTAIGIAARHPAELARWRWEGKFAYRPPGGEAWTDVALRVRSVLADIDADSPGGRALVVAHDAVVLLIRYVCERLSVERLLEIETTTVANASVTRLTRASGTGPWQLDCFNDVEHLAALDS